MYCTSNISYSYPHPSSIRSILNHYFPQRRYLMSFPHDSDGAILSIFSLYCTFISDRFVTLGLLSSRERASNVLQEHFRQSVSPKTLLRFHCHVQLPCATVEILLEDELRQLQMEGKARIDARERATYLPSPERRSPGTPNIESDILSDDSMSDSDVCQSVDPVDRFLHSI